MATAAKVWRWSGIEPPDGTASDLTTPPPKWFLEEVSYAAELYAIELHMQPRERGLEKVRVNVKDTDGHVHVFDVELQKTVQAIVKRVGTPSPTANVVIEALEAIETKPQRRDIHGTSGHDKSEGCPDPANCICDCLTCKRAWSAAGRPTPTGV